MGRGKGIAGEFTEPEAYPGSGFLGSKIAGSSESASIVCMSTSTSNGGAHIVDPETFLDLLCGFALDDCRIYDAQNPTLHVIEFKSEAPLELINAFRSEFVRVGHRPVRYKNGFAVACSCGLGECKKFWIARFSYEEGRSPDSGHGDVVRVHCQVEDADATNADAVSAFKSLQAVAA